MKRHANIMFFLMIAGLILLALPWMFQATAVDDDKGGTDKDIEVEGDAGGGFDWNTLHGFVMIENGYKVDEEFNVTFCTEVKYKENGEDGPNWYAAGHTFGSKENIKWDDDPEPEYTISREDLEEHKSEGDDTVNTTVYILGKYIRENPHGPDEARKAYKKITVMRPNHAPKAVAMITNSDENEKGMWDNWTTISSNDHGEIVYYIDSAGVSVKFYLNGSASTDQDGDEITGYRWDLDGNGKFGEESRERKMNTTVYLGEGDWLLGLIADDGNKYTDPPLDIRIVIRQPIRYPDLSVQNIQVVNKNGQTDIVKGDRCAIIAEVKNVGDKESTDPFDVQFQFWNRNDSPNEPSWQDFDLGTVRFTDPINVNGLKLIEYTWDTGSYMFYPAIYSFRAIADSSQEMKELREHNNYFPLEGEEMEAENITLLPNDGGGEADIVVVGTTLSKTEAGVNEVVWINITLRNDGDGNAQWVDIHYYIDGTWVAFKTVEMLEKEGGEWTEAFVFTGDSNKTFRIKFEVKDDGEIIHTVDAGVIRVSSSYDPTGGGQGGGENTIEDEEGNAMLPLIIVAVVVVAGLGGAGFFFMRKKDEDVW
jgi:hypothetical protein